MLFRSSDRDRGKSLERSLTVGLSLTLNEETCQLSRSRSGTTRADAPVVEVRSIARVSEGEHAAGGEDPNSQRIHAVGHHLLLVDLEIGIHDDVALMSNVADDHTQMVFRREATISNDELGPERKYTSNNPRRQRSSSSHHCPNAAMLPRDLRRPGSEAARTLRCAGD